MQIFYYTKLTILQAHKALVGAKFSINYQHFATPLCAAVQILVYDPSPSVSFGNYRTKWGLKF